MFRIGVWNLVAAFVIVAFGCFLIVQAHQPTIPERSQYGFEVESHRLSKNEPITLALPVCESGWARAGLHLDPGKYTYEVELPNKRFERVTCGDACITTGSKTTRRVRVYERWGAGNLVSEHQIVIIAKAK